MGIRMRSKLDVLHRLLSSFHGRHFFSGFFLTGAPSRSASLSENTASNPSYREKPDRDPRSSQWTLFVFSPLFRASRGFFGCKILQGRFSNGGQNPTPITLRFRSSCLPTREISGEASSYPVLRETNSSPPPLGTEGYHPAAGVNLAAAHRWVTYDAFVCVLRELMEVSLRHAVPYADVEAKLKHLYNEHPAPFAADRRFPDGEVYVCVDRSPVGSLVVRMREALALGLGGVREQFDAVRAAMDVVTGEDASTRLPVLFNRSIFEPVFQLQWRDTCSGCGGKV